jgi:hypothetical protein
MPVWRTPALAAKSSSSPCDSCSARSNVIRPPGDERASWQRRKRFGLAADRHRSGRLPVIAISERRAFFGCVAESTRYRIGRNTFLKIVLQKVLAVTHFARAETSV